MIVPLLLVSLYCRRRCLHLPTASAHPSSSVQHPLRVERRRCASAPPAWPHPALADSFHPASPPCSIYRDLNGGAVPPPHLRGLIGTCSAACVLTLTLPLEVVRRRLQVQVR